MLVSLEIMENSNPQEADADVGDKVVDTFAEKPERNIDTRYMTSSDLAALKQSDPFMYFSIPVVREAEMMGRDVDMSLLRGSGNCRRKSRLSCETADFDIDDLDLDDIATLSDGRDQESEDSILSFLGRYYD
jgi:hypothetical protein